MRSSIEVPSVLLALLVGHGQVRDDAIKMALSMEADGTLNGAEDATDGIGHLHGLTSF